MDKKKGMSLRAQRIMAYITLSVIAFFCLVWFYILFINTTRSNAQLARGFTVVPGSYLITNMKNLFTKSSLPVIHGMLNSLIVACISAAGCTYISALTAYAIHVYEFRFKNAIFTFVMMVMMVPNQVTALGLVRVLDTMGLLDTYMALIMPSFAAPIVFYYFKQYMESSLPVEIIEAARIDGSGEFATFNKIVLPLLKPALAVQGIFAFVTSWNNYFIPALIVQTDKHKTLPILIAQLRSADFLKFDMGQVYAMITFSILPVIVVYLILSRNIVEGVAVGAVKG